MGNLAKRLEKLEAALAARRQHRQIVKAVRGPQDRNTVLDQMVSDGEITEDQRSDVFLIRQIVVPWKQAAEKPKRDYFMPLETKAPAGPVGALPTEEDHGVVAPAEQANGKAKPKGFHGLP